jgi:hypothetical protein
MSHVFISYSRLDSDIVGLIEYDLVEGGHVIWRDSENIKGGEQWSDAIEQGIQDAYVLIVILSPSSLKSEWVNREITFAVEHPRKIPIIPIMLENAPLPLMLQKWQTVDFSPVRETEGSLQISAYRQAIGRLLRDLEEVRPVLRYMKELQDVNEDIRENAARALGEIADPIAAEALIATLSDLDEDVRFEATRALGNLACKSAFKHLVRLLSEEDPDLCAAAADALGKVGFTHAIGSLLQLLDHKDRFVRESAARSLGKIGELGAVEPLIQIMRNDSISEVRAAATVALRLIGGPVAERAISRKKAMKTL